MNSKLQSLLSSLQKNGSLHSAEVLQAFTHIDRKFFVPSTCQKSAYCDHPLPIGYGQTISQPTTVAIMLELLEAQPGNSILDIGSGSGYTSALLAFITGKNGRVTALDRIPQLVKMAERNLNNFPELNCEFLLAETEILGIPGQTFDRILVSAAADVFPAQLLLQLKAPGKMVIPVQNSMYLYQKDINSQITSSSIFGFSFVPLIHQ